MFLDLHVHSTASDGEHSPKRLINNAMINRIQVFSITDHDTISGLPEAVKEADFQQINFVSGIEISSQDIEEIHILGYGIDYNNQELMTACDSFSKARANRGQAIVDYLKSLNIEVDLGMVKSYAKDGNLGRPHFARYLVEHGIVKNRREAFDKYLDTQTFREATDRHKPGCHEAIELIHNAGGKAVLAHPGMYRMSEDSLDGLVQRLVEMNIDGIECFYSRHRPEQTKKYLEYTREYDLKTSCGSDFHGEKVKPDVRLGMDFDFEQFGNSLIITPKGELR